MTDKSSKNNPMGFLFSIHDDHHRRGQALVEYLLILVVTIAIVLGITIQFFKPLQYFLKDYMGTYVSCLLETGELPSLGGENNLKDDSCRANWEKARTSAGLSPSRGNGKGDDNGSDSENNSKKSRSKEDSGSSSDGQGSYAGSDSRKSPFFRPPRTSRGGDGGANGANRSVVIELNEEKGSSKFFKARMNVGSVSTRQRATVLDMSSMPESVRKKLEKEIRNAPRVVASDENYSNPRKKIRINPPKPKPIVESQETPMTFGNYIKIFFILAIIIVLVLLIGGQAAQLSKSWEK